MPQQVGGRGGVKVCDAPKLRRLHARLRVLAHPGKKLIFDASRHRLDEGNLFRFVIISCQGAFRKDVAGGNFLKNFFPARRCHTGRDGFNLHVDIVIGGGAPIAKSRRQRLADDIPIRLLHLPQLHRPGCGSFAGIRHVKHIAQALLPVPVDKKGDAGGAVLHVAVHGIVPEAILGAGCGGGPLGENHHLLRVGVLAKPPGGAKKRLPLRRRPGQTPRRLLQQAAVLFQFRFQILSSIFCKKRMRLFLARFFLHALFFAVCFLPLLHALQRRSPNGAGRHLLGHGEVLHVQLFIIGADPDVRPL